MKPRWEGAVVEPGRFEETPTPDASGMARRAFGEFESPRGELASYAFGWTTGDPDHTGRITVGIGAGNEGGTTIHAAVFDHDGGYAFSLIDEPFADVPQGGPHATADEAREHPDLQFMWVVADSVMEADPRAWWMRHWVLRTPAVTTPEVFDDRSPVLLVVNDMAEAGGWQLIGPSDAGDDIRVLHLWHAVDEDPTLAEVLDLAPGEQAVRSAVGGPWTRSTSAPEP